MPCNRGIATARQAVALSAFPTNFCTAGFPISAKRIALE